MAIKKSPRSPAIPLPAAIERVRKIYTAEGTNTFDDEVAVKQMGFSGLNGGSREALAAVRAYGLIEGRGSNLQVSRDAIVILVDEDAEDQGDRSAALRRCLQHNPIFSELYERFANESSVLNVSSYLQKELGFNPSKAVKVAKSYKASADLVFANSEDYDEDSQESADEEQSEFVGFTPPGATLTQKPQNPGAGMKQETFTLASSEILIQFPDQMTGEDYEDFVDWLEILKRKVGRTVQTAPPTEEQGE